MDKNAILVDAKNEYTKQFINVLYLPVFQKIETLYENQCENTKNKNDILKNFQICLQEIPYWNKLQIDEVTKQILEECEWFTDLLAAIFITNVKILSSIKMKKGKKNINITMPKCEDFIHKLYSNVAESLYYSPDFFSINKNGKYPLRKTKHDVIYLIKDAIEITIADLLPFQNILQNYLQHNLDDSESSEDEPEDEPDDEPDEPDEPDDEPDEEPDEEPELNSEFTQPAQPSEFTQPTQPAEFTQPTQPAEFTQPVQAETSTKPAFFQSNDPETKTVSLNPTSPINKPMFFNDASD